MADVATSEPHLTRFVLKKGFVGSLVLTLVVALGQAWSTDDNFPPWANRISYLVPTILPVLKLDGSANIWDADLAMGSDRWSA